MKIEVKEGKIKHAVEVSGSTLGDLKISLLQILGEDVPVEKMKLLKGGKFIDLSKEASTLSENGINEGQKMILMWKDGYRRPTAASTSQEDTSGYPTGMDINKENLLTTSGK